VKHTPKKHDNDSWDITKSMHNIVLIAIKVVVHVQPNILLLDEVMTIDNQS
jgi:ABC-type polysaccharide/polyol phosphate transport system ATPase subunit